MCLAAQSKKTKNGRRHRRERNPPESMVAMIDRLLMEPVSATVNGEATKMPALEAIVFQLYHKATSGNAHAHRVFLKYQEFASRNSEKKLELTFLENDYTLALANKPSSDNA
jgi:hypothetical protein